MTSRVVELAGPAGAGKTTIVQALSAHRAGIRIGLPTGRLDTARSLAHETPLLAGRAATGRWWSIAELRSIGYLRATHQVVARADPKDLMLLDHGPVFRLASLLVAAGETSSPGFGRWWSRSAREWADVLEAVVWLDAPDEVLIERIESRPRAHRVRGAERSNAEAFLESYREAFSTVLDVVKKAGTPVFHVDAQLSPREVTDAIRACIGGRP